MTPLKAWMTHHAIRGPERRALADGAGITLNHLSQLVNGRRDISARQAARLEESALRLPRVRSGAVPALLRGQICSVCACCPFHPATARDREVAA